MFCVFDLVEYILHSYAYNNIVQLVFEIWDINFVSSSNDL